MKHAKHRTSRKAEARREVERRTMELARRPELSPLALGPASAMKALIPKRGLGLEQAIGTAAVSGYPVKAQAVARKREKARRKR